MEVKVKKRKGKIASFEGLLPNNNGRRHERWVKARYTRRIGNSCVCERAQSLTYHLSGGSLFVAVREVADCLQVGIIVRKETVQMITHLSASSFPINLFIFVHSSFRTLSPARSAPTSNTVTTPAAPPTPSLFPSFSSQQTFSRLLAA